MQFEDYIQSYTDIKALYSDPENSIGKIFTVKGWIKTFRKSGKIAFGRLFDGSYFQTLQIIFDGKDQFDEIFKRGKTGLAIEVTGLVIKSLGKEQSIEMQARQYQIDGDVANPDTYPIAKSELSMDFLRTVPHLKHRTDTHSSIVKIKSEMRFAMAEYFRLHGFMEVQVPCITDNECESGANPFTVTTIVSNDLNTPVDYSKDFFKKHCYLTVSGQLHLEAIVLGGLSKAWTMTTAFRAEPSTGPRHLSEFWMAELEFCFGTLESNMKINEGCIKYCFQKILTECHLELEFLQKKFKSNLISMIKKYATVPFVISTHAECVKMMLDDIDSGKVTIDSNKQPDGNLHIFKEKPDYANDLSKDHERYITEIIYGHMPVFVRFFPAKIKSFYMPKIDVGSDVEHVDGFDLLFPEIGEVVGGSQRETDLDTLIARMKEMGVNPESLDFYLDLRKWGTVPHGGIWYWIRSLNDDMHGYLQHQRYDPIS